jgi:hypothetical protein
MYRALRFTGNPMIHAGLDHQIGANINGPSIIRVPDWVRRPLGRYYLYFAHHQGTFIRLAYADRIEGPWTVHPGGTLRLEETCCRNHIASPDVHVHPGDREIIMYFHGCMPEGQRSFRASSADGLRFTAFPEVLGPFYFRVFRHGDAWFAIAKTVDAMGGGVLLRSSDGVSAFERGPDIIPRQRHVAVMKKDDTLRIFFSRGEDCPERIFVSTMRLTGDWRRWRPSDSVEILRPEMEYEGAGLQLRPSLFGSIHEPVNQLRDPAIFEEDNKLYLLYSAAGETSICGARLCEAHRSQLTSASDA